MKLIEHAKHGLRRVSPHRDSIEDWQAALFIGFLAFAAFGGVLAILDGIFEVVGPPRFMNAAFANQLRFFCSKGLGIAMKATGAMFVALFFPRDRKPASIWLFIIALTGFVFIWWSASFGLSD